AAFALWRAGLAQRAGNAGRDRAAAAMVSLSSVQGVVLGAHGSGAAAGAAGVEAEGEKSARRDHRRAFSPAAEKHRARGQGGSPKLVVVHVFPRRRCDAPPPRSLVSEATAPARDRSGARLRYGTAQR